MFTIFIENAMLRHRLEVSNHSVVSSGKGAGLVLLHELLFLFGLNNMLGLLSLLLLILAVVFAFAFVVTCLVRLHAFYYFFFFLCKLKMINNKIMMTEESLI